MSPAATASPCSPGTRDSSSGMARSPLDKSCPVTDVTVPSYRPSLCAHRSVIPHTPR